MRTSLVDGHFSLACIFSKAGNTKKMLSHLSSAISLKPNHVSAHYMLGAYEAKNGNFQEAISSLQLVVDLKPTLLDAWLLLASVLMDAGRVTES